MINSTLAGFSTLDAVAVHLHAAYVVSGIACKILVKQYISAITKAELDAVVQNFKLNSNSQ